MTTKTRWMERAEYVADGDSRILGEDERGDLWVPSRTRAQWWDRRFNPRNPSHWRYWLRSRRTSRIAFLGAGS